MNHMLIANISQLKLTEINTLTHAVDQLQSDVDRRRAAIASFAARNDAFSDLLNTADALRDSTAATLDQGQAIHAATRTIDATSNTATQRVGQIRTMMDQMAAKQIELLRQLVGVVNLLEKAHQHAQQQKAVNPLIPDALLTLLDKAVEQSANVLSLSLVAQDSCLMTDGGLTATHGNLLQARDAVAELLAALNAGDDSVLGRLGEIQRYAADRYAETLAASHNASQQLDHANRECAAREARLSALKAGLSAMNV